jgi:excisionase family DNA binding protein
MVNATYYEEIFTVEDVSKIFKITVGSVRNLIKKGIIPAIKIGKQYRIPKHIVDNIFSTFYGASVTEIGFGVLKKHKFEDSVEYVNKIRAKNEHKDFNKILEELENV